MNTNYDAALSYITRGWYIFPCGPDKTPMTEHGFKDATRNPEQVKAWWDKYPGAAIGVDCGRSGLVAIDLDLKNGHDGIAEWENFHIETLGALISHTPSGGKHLIFGESKAQIKNSTSKIATGIDVRGNGGYVILPPSKVESGEYSTEGDWSKPPAPIPSDLFFLLIESTQPSPQTNQPSIVNPDAGNHWLSKALERAVIGTRNDTGLWLAEQLRDAGLSQSEAEPLMIDYAKHVPQSPSAAYTKDEAVATLKSVYTRPAREPAHIPMEIPPPEKFAETSTKVDEIPDIRLPTAFDILTAIYPEPVWIIPDYLPAGMAILAGRPKIGKSWMALQIALSVASGGMCFDKHITPGKVLYLALEDSHRRLQERMKFQGWTQEACKLVTMLTLDEFRKYIGFLHKNGAVKLAALIQTEGYRFIVVDSLERAFMGLRDMNDSQEVTAALSPIQTLSLESNCLTLLLDHHGKPKGYNPNPIDDVMSSTAKSAIADTIMGLYRNEHAQCHSLMMIGREVGELTLSIRWDRTTRCWQLIPDESEKLTEKQMLAIKYLAGVKKANNKEISQALNMNAGTCLRCVLNPLVFTGQITRNEKKEYLYGESN